MDTKAEMDVEHGTQDCSVKRIEDILKPLLISMKLFGVYHDVHGVNSVGPMAMSQQQTRSRNTFSMAFVSRCYSVSVLILVWANFVRFVVTFKQNGGSLAFRIAMIVWIGIVAVVDLIMFVICERMCHLRSFYRHWNEVHQDNRPLITECHVISLNRTVLIGTIAGWICQLMTMISALLLYLLADVGFAEMIARPFTISLTINILSVLVMFHACGVYIFPVIFVIVLCCILRSSFNKVSSVVDRHIRTAENGVPSTLGQLRRLHLQLCREVAVLDRSVCLLVAVENIINMPLACFIAYQVVSINEDTIVLIVNLFWMTANIVIIVSVTLSCATVHGSVCITSTAIRFTVK